MRDWEEACLGFILGLFLVLFSRRLWRSSMRTLERRQARLEAALSVLVVELGVALWWYALEIFLPKM
jgi:hypothetical protein